MKTYTIQTGGQEWKVKAKNGKDAVIAAFKKKAPKAPGILTEVRSKEEPDFFVDSIKYLRLAGYKVEI